MCVCEYASHTCNPSSSLTLYYLFPLIPSHTHIYIYTNTHTHIYIHTHTHRTMCKGQPVTTDDERLHVINSIKWVDEVVRDVPYVMNEAYLEYVIEKYDIDYIVHGDDPCIVDGKDVYETAKKAGMYRSIPRTEGVSTTDIVGRMLLNTRNHHTTDVSNLRARSGSMGSLSNESNENSKNNNSMNNSLSSINSPKGSNQESDSHTESGGVVTESLTGSNRSSIGSLNGDGQGEKTRETGEAEIDTQISDPYNMYEEDAEAAMYKSKSSFLTTSHILRLFSAGECTYMHPTYLHMLYLYMLFLYTIYIYSSTYRA